MFNINGKVALVTGGASGIGLLIAQELLRIGLKACALADINANAGEEAVKLISNEFGPNKVIFVEANVFRKTEFETAFQATIEKFKHVDILVNNAAILNDANWEETIQININGTINGILLGINNYLQHYRSGSESVIINLGSISGLDPLSCFPIYSCSKFALVGLTRSFGAQEYYNLTKVRVIAICPGVTKTPLVADESLERRTIGPAYAALIMVEAGHKRSQPAEFLAKAVTQIIQVGESSSVWVVEDSEPAYEVTFPTRQERRIN